MAPSLSQFRTIVDIDNVLVESERRKLFSFEREFYMNRVFARTIFILSIVVLLTSTGCRTGGESSDAPAASSTEGVAKAPTGVYESQLPDRTVLRIEFLGDGKGKMTMIEDGTPKENDAKWIVNGESVLVEGAEGFALEFKWKGDTLVTNSVGTTLTFTKK